MNDNWTANDWNHYWLTGSVTGTTGGTWTGDTLTWPYVIQQPQPVLDWEKCTFTIIGNKEGIVVKQAKSYLVIQRGSGTVAAVEETEGDALSAAARFAAKTGEEYFVFRPGKVVRQKPVDIETIDP